MKLINFNLSVFIDVMHALSLCKACFVSELATYRGEGYAA